MPGRSWRRWRAEGMGALEARAALALALGVVAGCGKEPAPAPQAQGREIYDIRCAACHGAEGRGNGPAAAAITPKPRDLSDPAFWRGRTKAQLRLAVLQGRPGTLMAPYEGVLSPAEIDAVIDHLVSAFRPAR